MREETKRPSEPCHAHFILKTAPLNWRYNNIQLINFPSLLSMTMLNPDLVLHVLLQCTLTEPFNTVKASHSNAVLRTINPVNTIFFDLA